MSKAISIALTFAQEKSDYLKDNIKKKSVLPNCKPNNYQCYCGGSYNNYSIIYPPNPILSINAPILC